MTLFSGIVVYIVIWWVVFFMTLPWGAHSPHETGDPVEAGNVPSAPHRPRVGLKALITTLISAALWVAVYFVIDANLISFRDT